MKLFTWHAVFVGNIAPVDDVVINFYIKDLLDISNVRINATEKSLKGHCATRCLLGPLYYYPLIFLKSR